MKVSSLKATAFFALVALVATAKIASAAALTADDAKCRSGIAKNTGKLASTISKAWDGCVKTAVKNGAGTCATTAGVDTKAKVAPAKTKVTDGIAGSCDDTAEAVALSEHQLCGTPIGGPAITSFAAVGPCLNDLVDQNVARWRNAILNPNFAGVLADATKAQGKCANAIAKNATKLLSTIQKEQSKAQNTSDKALGDSAYVNSVGLGGKVAGAITKLSDGITKACQPVEDDLGGSGWANIKTCDDDLAGVIACVTDKTVAVAEGITASAYDQPGSCPSAVLVKIHNGAQGGAVLGPTSLDVGHTGFGHNADVIDDFHGAVNIACGAAPNDCTACTATSSCAEGNCRCSNALQTHCNVPFVQDTCGAGNTCNLLFGPPLPLSAAGTPTCIINKINSELVNTANIATGESDTAIDNRAIVFLGISQAQPCPTCEAGLCNGGQRAGLACSVDGSSPFGDVSYDCPPSTLSNISGAGLKIGLNLTDNAISMPMGLKCDPPLDAAFPAVSCACSTCSLDNTIPCNSNAECTGFGVCRVDGLHGGATRVPNACNDGTCDDQGNEEGKCTGTGPTDSYCDGFLKGDGSGIVTCATNADCTVGAVGVDAGGCTITADRPCFLNPIDADGTPGSEGAVLVSNFCSPPTASGAVNGAAGSPGPARLSLDFEFVGRCGDGSIWGPGGANCQ